MKLNPAKYVFGVFSKKFLGFMVSQQGIEVNQKRFVSKATDKCLPFSKTFKQVFQQTNECEAAFQTLNEYLSKPPFLSPSMQGADLFLYLTVSQTIVNSALIHEENKIQWSVCYIGQAFQGVEMKYPRMEKLALALLFAPRKLRPHFQTHAIIIIKSQPVKKSMSSSDAARRMIRWAIELN